MKFNSRLVHASALAAMLGLMSLQAGCSSDVGAHIAMAIRLANAHDVTVSVNQKISEYRFKEAQDEGIAFLKDHEDKSGQLSWALARASAKLGNLDLAVKFAGEAVRAGAVSHVQLMGEPMLEPVRSDIRFISLAAAINMHGRVVVGSPGSSDPVNASETAGGQASAGDVSVNLPD